MHSRCAASHLLALLALALCCALGSAQSTGASSAKDLERAWKRLSPALRSEAAQYFSSQALARNDLVRQGIAKIRAQSGRDPGLWPLRGELEFFDPKLHAPAQPIARKRLDPTSTKAKAALAKLAPIAPGELVPAYLYDWGTRTVVRLGNDEDPERVFRNAQLGAPPDLDLAIALVELALDDGSQQKALAAFGHAYTDRDGNVYPLTLYEAWSSGEDFEMPDVDSLGIVHTLLDEWKRFVAPVPPKQHGELYEKTLKPVFIAARRHRGLRESLAAICLRSAPPLGEGYAEGLTRWHALWSYQSGDPQRVARGLPQAAKWTEYINAWTLALTKTPNLLDQGRARQRELAACEQAVRDLMGSVLAELGGRAAAPDEH